MPEVLLISALFLTAVDGNGFIPNHIDEEDRQLGIELFGCLGQYLIAGKLGGKGWLIRPFGNHGIEGIGDGKTSASDWNFIPIDSPGVSSSIPSLVMGNHTGYHVIQTGQVTDDGYGMLHVGLQNVVFFGGQFPLLGQ